MRIRLPHMVSWQRYTLGSEWDGETLGDAESIPARIERRTRMVQTDTGDERVDQTRIMVGSDSRVTENDRLEGERVEGVDEQVDIYGNVVGYICYVESSRGI